MRLKYLALGCVPIFVILAAGCGGSGSLGSAAVSITALAPTGKIVPFSTVAAMKAGAVFYVYLDRPEGRVFCPIKLSGTSNDANGRKIIFTIDNHPVGSGDSGSLVVDGKGNAVGALSAGFGASMSIFEATSIEDEQSILLSGPTTAKHKVTPAAVSSDGLSRKIRGVSPYLWAIISKDPHNTLSRSFVLDTSAQPKFTTKVALAKDTSFSKTIFMVSSYGDAVSAFTFGSVTMPYLGKLLCYGHPLNWEGGSQQIPCYYGTVTNFIVDPANGSSKLAFPDMTKPAGLLIDDRRFGVVVDPTGKTTPIPIDGTITLNANAPVTFHGKVAHDPIYETWFALTNVAQGTANVVDASDLAGSATGSATVNFADGTSQTIDLADSGSSALISDLYSLVEQALFDPNTFKPIPLSGITFSISITTG